MTPASGAILSACCRRASLWMLLFQLCSYCAATEKMKRLVGEEVLLKPSMNISASQIDDVRWKLNNQRISTKLNITRENKDKYSLFTNGTLLIHDGEKKNSGNYTVTIFNQSGNLITEETFHLTFLEPISELRVWRTCPESRNVTVTCKALSGDDVQFLWTWTFNGTLQSTASSPESENLTVHIQFEGHVPEDLTCQASTAGRVISTQTPVCRGYLSTLAGVALFLTALLCVGVLTAMRKIKKDDKKVIEENIYLDMRGHQQNKATPEPPAPENLTYELLMPQQQNLSPDASEENVYVL